MSAWRRFDDKIPKAGRWIEAASYSGAEDRPFLISVGPGDALTGFQREDLIAYLTRRCNRTHWRYYKAPKDLPRKEKR